MENKVYLFDPSKNLRLKGQTSAGRLFGFFFQVQTVSAKKLDKIADKNQLPSELGGSVNYNHRMWINNRIDFESFVQSADNILAVSSPDDNRVQDLNKAAVADCCEKGKINKLK